MKSKLTLALIVASGIAFADQCAAPAQKVIDKLQTYNKTAVQVNYSADKADYAKMCQADIIALDKNVKVILKQVDGTGQFKFSKPD